MVGKGNREQSRFPLLLTAMNHRWLWKRLHNLLLTQCDHMITYPQAMADRQRPNIQAGRAKAESRTNCQSDDGRNKPASVHTAPSLARHWMGNLGLPQGGLNPG